MLRFLTILCACAFASSLGGVAAASDKVLQQRDEKTGELRQVQSEIEALSARRERLEVEIAALNQDQAAINRALIEAAKRGQQLEGEVAQSEQRLAELGGTRDTIRASLADRRALLAETIGALQRMGRSPPPAILVRPEDALASVRSAIMLGAVVPQIRDETRSLTADLDVLAQTTRKIEQEREALRVRLNALAEDETRLTLLIKEKNSLARKSQEALEEENRKAAELAANATSLKGLIADLEKEIASAAAAAKAARKAEAQRNEAAEERLARARASLEAGNGNAVSPLASLDPKTADNSRLSPAVAFGDAKGALPLPVQGVELHGFGEKTATSNASPNVAIATRPNARVRSPADGWVVYAGPFRSYGQLIILNVGDDHHVVLSGMADTDVTQGRFVLTGEPVGRMGATRVAATGGVKLGSTRPVLYVEFRKDGNPVDPAPWWARAAEGPDNDS
ncbi:MAG: peptidoglycan DD-metalloendopeptidase family protein [Ahrensia sp.]|nr:peptidoglycan DD-metalloendopeptidase family protein [Ahrensia sp.]